MNIAEQRRKIAQYFNLLLLCAAIVYVGRKTGGQVGNKLQGKKRN